ncbi:hypothetical protein [Flavobacterium sp. F52]|uniref:hypothetical protein n=1 Tax=Flavobacterium sp. F52 TaxID=1202532 RepID=UPI000272EED8|nr:hypothetical protein [Flavobacterium sp. F52]EJG03320.1 hypothetical protein FF52_01385 [Flavobacterium sp. F52]
MKNFFLVVMFTITFFSISAQTKEKYKSLLLEKSNEYTGQNLRDSVKTVYSRIYAVNKNLTEIEKSEFIMNNGIHCYKYIMFDKYGRIKETFGARSGENFLTKINKNKTKLYEYDENDWKEKSKQEIQLKQYYPVSNHNLLQKLNQINVPKDTVIIGDKIWSEYDADVYSYIYDKKGQIIEEQKYCVYRVAPVIENTTPNNDDLSVRKLFIYNNKGQVVNQKITNGPFSKKIPYTDMGTESPFCEDLQFHYSYDSLGRITEVRMFGCGKTVAKEEYTYHPIEDYVQNVKYYITGPGEISNPTKNFVRTYNKRGDIIKSEFIPDNLEQNTKPKSRYYTYEYDSHNNWIKCNIFLEGTSTGEPTLIAERKIEYYN